jgi:DNA-binding transcriptional LysR family regulator
MDRLAATRVFVTVVEKGSLTQAAEHLDMSTAMVSRYLAAVEGWLGARLLHRTTRRLSLTEAGQASLAGCRQLLELAEDVKHQAGEATRVPSGRLRITSSASFAEAQLAPALVEFQQRHPQVDFSLVTADRSVDLAAERIDLAVRITNTLEPTLIARPLAVCRSVLCAAPAYLRAHGEPRTVQALQSHLCITHAIVGAAQFRFRRRRQLIELPVNDRLSTNDTGVLRRTVIEGGGIGILPTYLVGEDLKRGRLVRVLPSVEPETLGIHAIFLSRQHQPLALRLLVDFLAVRFGGDLPPWDR